MSFINLFSKRCFSDKSYKIHTYISKRDGFKDIVEESGKSFTVKYLNGFYCNVTKTSTLPDASQDIQIKLPSGIALTIAIQVADLPNGFLEELKNAEDAIVFLDKYMEITPIDQKQQAYLTFLTSATASTISLNYHIGYDNGGKTFKIRIVNINNNNSVSCEIKTSADKDGFYSSGTADVVDNLDKLLDSTSPTILKFYIKEI